MSWLSIDDILDVGEVVVRLKDSGLPVRFLGLSVHQIAIVTGEGDIIVRGELVQREWIEGWMRLPRLNRESRLCRFDIVITSQPPSGGFAMAPALRAPGPIYLKADSEYSRSVQSNPQTPRACQSGLRPSRA